MPTDSYNPKCSYDPKARYTTAGSSYDRLLDNGPLTNAKIRAYALVGRYGPVAQRYAQGLISRPRRPGSTKSKNKTTHNVNTLLDELIHSLVAD